VLLRDGTSGPALVVVPSGLVMQWRRQLREWAPELSLSTCTGPPENRRGRWRAPAQVYLTSFDALRGDMALPAPLGPRHRGWAVVVADEAQRIKNAHTAISAMVKALPRRRAWALTGTPLENRPDDAASILDFVAPGLYDPAHMVAGLRRVLSQVQLRRRRADVLHDLPPKTVFELAPELLPQQRAAYEVAQREGLVWLRSLGTELRIVHVLELILRLKQICNACPRTGVSAKLDDLLPRLHQVAEAGEKALVFSQFVAAPFGAEAVAAAMKPLNPVLLTGRMSIAARDDAVAQYIRPCDEPGTELGAHRRALADAGCGQVVEEPLGAEDGGAQPELDVLLGRLQPGDVLVVPQLDSLARSLPDLVRTLQRHSRRRRPAQPCRGCPRWRIPGSGAGWAGYSGRHTAADMARRYGANQDSTAVDNRKHKGLNNKAENLHQPTR
jgi:hypothetical protein